MHNGEEIYVVHGMPVSMLDSGSPAMIDARAGVVVTRLSRVLVHTFLKFPWFCSNTI